MLKRPVGASRREANGGVQRAERSDGARRARQGRGAARARGRGSMKIGRRGPECREASGARRRGERGATVTAAKADCTPPSRRDQADRRRAPCAAPGIPARSPRTPANRERRRRRAQVPGRVLAAAVRPKRLDLLGTGTNGTLGRFWRGTGQGGRDVGADNVWSYPSGICGGVRIAEPQCPLARARGRKWLTPFPQKRRWLATRRRWEAARRASRRGTLRGRGRGACHHALRRVRNSL